MKSVAWAIVAALTLVACGIADPLPESEIQRESTAIDDGGDVGSSGASFRDPIDVTGNIVTAGSSTVFPLSEAVADAFQNEGYGDELTIDSIGSGGGFERFCEAGETDISNASRPIKESEVESCRAIGREPLEFRVGTDALAVTVSPNNYFAESLTLEQLAALFGGAETWADVDPSFPAHPVAIFSPGTASGTFDYFVEEVFDEDPEPLLSADPQLSEDDNVLVQGVSGDTCTEGEVSTSCAVAYFGFAYYLENADRLKVLSIEGVEPSASAVDAGEYPLARPMYIYSAPSILQEKPQVGDFIYFYLVNVNDIIGEIGYFEANQSVLDDGLDALSQATGR